jgi:cystathionine beta-synthase
MVEEWEKLGKIKPGDILIEPTSGNTGIGLCLTAALKGYKMIICLPQKMSGEKVNTMKALGAEILRTPTEAAWDAEDSHIFLSARLAKDLGGHVLDQYKNAGNPLAHYEGTAEEIIEQTEGKLDYMIMSAGTGGTMTGIAKKLKEKIPNVKIVAVDPYGSILAKPDSLNDGSARTGQGRLQGYQVEGIGYDFIPTVLDQDVADYWVKTDDDEAFAMCRQVIRHEGLMIGGSCGSTMAGAYRFIREHKIGKDKRVAVLLADGARNYMSKFLCDDWMRSNGFDPEQVQRAVDEKGAHRELYGLP